MQVIKFSIQTKEHKETMQVQSREGPAVGLEMSALYRLNSDSAAKGIVDFQKIVAAGISEQ